MKLTVEKAENGYIVTDIDGRQWIALENEYASTYAMTLPKVLVAALEKPEASKDPA